MELLGAQILNGITLGSVYALIALGFTLLYTVLKVLQIAHGEVCVIIMYISWQIYVWTTNVWLSFAGGMLVVILASLLIERFGFRILRQRRSRFHEPVVFALAISLLLTELFTRLFNFGSPINFPDSIKAPGTIFRFGLAVIAEKDIYIVVAVIIVLIVFSLFLNRTKYGKALQAVAIDWRIANLLGIPVNRAASLCFAIAGLLAGVTGILLAAYLGYASPSLGGSLSFKGIAVMLFAGASSFVGAVVCGLGLGLIEVITVMFGGGIWRDAVAFAAIIFVLLFRPEGVFGSKY